MQENAFTMQVHDKQTFIAFLKAFHADFQKNPDHWENNTLEAFLESLAAYAENIQSFYDNLELAIDVDKPSWRVFADMLKGASTYE